MATIGVRLQPAIDTEWPKNLTHFGTLIS